MQRQRASCLCDLYAVLNLTGYCSIKKLDSSLGISEIFVPLLTPHSLPPPPQPPHYNSTEQLPVFNISVLLMPLAPDRHHTYTRLSDQKLV